MNLFFFHLITGGPSGGPEASIASIKLLLYLKTEEDSDYEFLDIDIDADSEEETVEDGCEEGDFQEEVGGSGASFCGVCSKGLEWRRVEVPGHDSDPGLQYHGELHLVERPSAGQQCEPEDRAEGVDTESADES